MQSLPMPMAAANIFCPRPAARTRRLSGALRDRHILRESGLKGLYPYVEIVFEIADAKQHYHIPLLLAANGYTTYRGS